MYNITIGLVSGEHIELTGVDESAARRIIEALKYDNCFSIDREKNIESVLIKSENVTFLKIRKSDAQ